MERARNDFASAGDLNGAIAPLQGPAARVEVQAHRLGPEPGVSHLKGGVVDRYTARDRPTEFRPAGGASRNQQKQYQKPMHFRPFFDLLRKSLLQRGKQMVFERARFEIAASVPIV